MPDTLCPPAVDVSPSCPEPCKRLPLHPHTLYLPAVDVSPSSLVCCSPATWLLASLSPPSYPARLLSTPHLPPLSVAHLLHCCLRRSLRPPCPPAFFAALLPRTLPTCCHRLPRTLPPCCHSLSFLPRMLLICYISLLPRTLPACCQRLSCLPRTLLICIIAACVLTSPWPAAHMPSTSPPPPPSHPAHLLFNAAALPLPIRVQRC